MTEVVEDWLGLSLRIDTLWEIEETKSFDASSQGGGSQQDTVDGYKEMLLMFRLAGKLCTQFEQLVVRLGGSEIGEQGSIGDFGI